MHCQGCQRFDSKLIRKKEGWVCHSRRAPHSRNLGTLLQDAVMSCGPRRSCHESDLVVDLVRRKEARFTNGRFTENVPELLNLWQIHKAVNVH